MQKTAIVVPCYNEAARLKADEFAAFLDGRDDMAFCFVNDGSQDETAEVLHSIAARCGGKAQVVNLPFNRGKAEAVRAGVMQMVSNGQFRFIGYWDADLATPLAMIEKFLGVAAEDPKLKMIVGSRIRRLGASIRRQAIRHYLGRVFATCSGIITGLPVYDTQCGAKILDAQLARQVFAEPFVTTWMFDVELFLRVSRTLGGPMTLSACYEVPLETWDAVDGSKLRLWHFMFAPFDLLRILLKYGFR